MNQILFAFNNKLIGMKSLFNKAKINSTQKLIRQIKLISNKKGTEVQLKKNQKKCDHLREEIIEIKKLTINETAIFALDNDGINIEEYLKKNKNPTPHQLALTRVGFHKLFQTSLEKLKQDTNFQSGWKNAFIQFKSRNEKRKNWKEKQKMYKLIEQNLQLAANEATSENKSSNNETDPNKAESSKVEMNYSNILSNKKNSYQPNARNMDEYNSEDDDNFVNDYRNDEETDLESNSDTNYDSCPLRKAKLNDVENNQIFNNNYVETEENLEDEKIRNEKVSKINQKPIGLNPETYLSIKKLKPLVFNDKPSRMVIKQLNLDELNDLDEIPITNYVDSFVDDENYEKRDKKKSEEEKEYDENNFEPEKTIKINEDPFFLDKNGKEIEDVNHLTERNNSIYYNRRFNSRFKFENRKNDDDFDYNFDEKEEFIHKRNNLNSSYTASLSLNNKSEKFGLISRTRSFNSNKTEYKSRNNLINNTRQQDDYQNGRRSSVIRTPSGRSNDAKYYENYNRSDNNYKNNFKNRQTALSFNYQQYEKKEETSNLHPSWQAKKLMEEKLKNFKFEGKKITFDD